MDKLNYLIVLLTTLSIVNGDLKIIELAVPQSIESESINEVILDCDYEVKNEKGLEVKWFHDTKDQIYQWIPHTTQPQALGILKNRIDLDYKVSNDSNTMYRALRIRNIIPELSGSYTCKITSFYNEATATKQMIIYEVANEFEIEMDEENESVNCTASGLFPKPIMNLFISGRRNSTNVEGDADDEDEIGDERGVVKHHNISSILDFGQYRITEPVTFICDLLIPNTTYSRRKTLDYYPGGIPSSAETQIESDYELPTNATEQDNSSPTQHASSIVMSLVLSIFFQRLF